MKTALVIGGSGRTGHQIVVKLLEKGVACRVLARNPDAVRQQLSDAARVVQGDITDLGSVRTAVADAEGVVVVVESADSDDAPNSPERVHFQGAQNVITAARKHKPHVVLVSQIYITRPERYPEVRSVIHWRGRAEEALRASGLPYTIVRPSWLNDDPGSRHGLRLEQGDTGEGNITRADVATVCAEALLDEAALSKTFEVYNEANVPLQDWGDAFRSLRPDPTVTTTLE